MIDPTVIAHVTASKSTAHTVGEFLAWRVREDARMQRSLIEQVAAWFALRDGATRH